MGEPVPPTKVSPFIDYSRYFQGDVLRSLKSCIPPWHIISPINATKCVKILRAPSTLKENMVVKVTKLLRPLTQPHNLNEYLYKIIKYSM